MNKFFFIFLLSFSIYSNPIISVKTKDLKKTKNLNIYLYGQKNGSARILGEDKTLKYLNKNNIDYSIEYKSEKEFLLFKKSVISNENFIKYHELEFKINELVENYPALVEKIVIGKSLEGRDIIGLKTISDKLKPKYRIAAGIHGDEAMSYQFVFDFMVYLIENNKDYQSIFNNSEIWFIPMLNPDGAVNVTRKNSNNVDLNRNLGFFWKSISFSGEDNFSEPETKALRDLTLEENFTMSFAFHTYGDIINYVWNFSPDDVPDLAEIINISSIYQDFTNYELTEGFDWYQTTGDLNDYSYGTVGTLDWTIEINDSDKTGELFENNKNALLKVLKTSSLGVEGVIYDKDGIAVEAAIIVNDDSLFYSNKNGYFYRYLLDGVYNLKIIRANHKVYELTIEVKNNKESLEIYLEENKNDNMFIEKVVSVKSNFKTSDAYYNVLLPKNLLFSPDEKYFTMNSKGEVLLKLPSRVNDRHLDLLLLNYDNINLKIEAYTDLDSEAILSETYLTKDTVITIRPEMNYLKIIEDNENDFTAFIDSVLLKEIPKIKPIDPPVKDDKGDTSCTYNNNPNNMNFFMLILSIFSVYIFRWRVKIERK